MDLSASTPETRHPVATLPSMAPKRRFRTRMTAGLILVIPIWVTVLLIGFVFGLMRDASLWMVEALLTSAWIAGVLERIGVSAASLRSGGIEALPGAVRWILAGLSVLFTVGVVYSAGIVATNMVGRRVVHAVESLVDNLPFVKTIYRASKQVVETFAGESAQSFQRVVSVPFPTADVRTVGFITRVIPDTPTSANMCAVFIPTAPNPMTGFVFLVHRGELVDLNWTVEEALKVVISGGVLWPDSTVSGMPQKGSIKPLREHAGR